jgi:hypothetical protein
MEFRGFGAGAGEPLASPGSIDAEESGDLHDRAVDAARSRLTPVQQKHTR